MKIPHALSVSRYHPRSSYLVEIPPQIKDQPFLLFEYFESTRVNYTHDLALPHQVRLRARGRMPLQARAMPTRRLPQASILLLAG